MFKLTTAGSAGWTEPRAKQLDEEVTQLRKQLREGQEMGEKLRDERRSRIKNERQSIQARRELELAVDDVQEGLAQTRYAGTPIRPCSAARSECCWTTRPPTATA